MNKVLLTELYYRILPFRVCNHLFVCETSQFNSDMCRFFRKLYVSNKKISDYVNNNFYVEINRFQVQLSEGIVAAKKIYLFSHTNVVGNREDPFGVNLGGLHYESISSSFLLWKFYLDLLSRIVFNTCYRYVLPILVPNFTYGNCRKLTVCDSKNCKNLVLSKIKSKFYEEMVAFCKRIAEISCFLFNPYLVIDTFYYYRRSVVFLMTF